jgi:hypothetical protein
VIATRGGDDPDWPPGLPPLASTRLLHGGLICRTARGRLADGRDVVVKRCPYPAAIEADGLRAMAAAGAAAAQAAQQRQALRGRTPAPDRGHPGRLRVVTYRPAQGGTHSEMRVGGVQAGGLATSANALTFHGLPIGSTKLGGPSYFRRWS